jgi:hypothetical protein
LTADSFCISHNFFARAFSKNIVSFSRLDTMSRIAALHHFEQRSSEYRQRSPWQRLATPKGFLLFGGLRKLPGKLGVSDVYNRCC